MSDVRLSSDARAVIAAARPQEHSTREDRARIRRALDARLAGVAAVPGAGLAKAAAAHAPVHATGLLGAGVAAKVVAVVAVTAAVGGSATVAMHARHVAIDARASHAHVVHHATSRARPTRVPLARGAAVVVAPRADSPAALEAPIAVAAPTPSEPPLHVRRHDAPAEPRAGADEATVLGRAITLDRAGRRTEALALLELSATRRVASPLGRERAALHAILLCETGRESEARAEAAALLAAAPASPYAARLERACRIGGENNPVLPGRADR